MARIDLLVDLQYGSCGKGKLAYELTQRKQYSAGVANNMPNAGHTVAHNGKKVVFKVLPSCCFNVPRVYLAAGSVFALSRLIDEARYAKQIIIHANAQLISDNDRTKETRDEVLAAIGSTAQGCTLPMIRRIRRQSSSRIGSRRISDLPNNIEVVTPELWIKMIHGEELLFGEVAQGVMLSNSWGTFPFTTSRDCLPTTLLGDAGLPWHSINEIYGLARFHPIRVGHGKGYSGPMPLETTWDDILSRAGYTADEIAFLLRNEITTVTKRLRRVSYLCHDELNYALRITGTTRLLMNFGEYLHRRLHNSTLYEDLEPIMGHIRTIEEKTKMRVMCVGTSADTTIWRPE